MKNLAVTWLLLSCFTSLVAVGQSINKNAALLLTNGDTLQGQLRYYDWNRSFAEIRFTDARTQNEATYSARQVQRIVVDTGSVVYDGRRFKTNYYHTGTVARGASPISQVDSSYGFAELLVDADRVQLYRYYDRNGARRFSLVKDDINYPLDDINVTVEFTNGIQKVHRPAYRGTLQTVLTECPSLDVYDVTYTEEALIDIIKKYALYCQISAQLFRQPTTVRRLHLLMGVVAGGIAPLLREEGKLVYPLGAVCLEGRFPNRFYNYFVLTEIGTPTFQAQVGPYQRWLPSLGLYGGRYFGQHDLQLKAFVGIATAGLPLTIGIGVTYRKWVSLETRFSVVAIARSANEPDLAFPLSLFARVLLPLNKR